MKQKSFPAICLLMLVVTCGAAVHVSLEKTPVVAQPLKGISSVFVPGYVDIDLFPLAPLVSTDLRPACALLQQGKLGEAQGMFAAAIRSDPNNLAAYVGYLQTAGPELRNLLPQYQADPKQDASVVNEFKLGVCALYIIGLTGTGYPVPSQGVLDERRQMGQIARDSLQKAYRQSHEPLVGFVLCSAYLETGGPPVFGAEMISVGEDQIRRMGGPDVYNAYLRAKKKGWTGPPMPIPNLSPAKLQIFRHAAWLIWVVEGGPVGDSYVSKIENGRTVTVRVPNSNTPTQNNAHSYLGAWRERIKQAYSKSK